MLGLLWTALWFQLNLLSLVRQHTSRPSFVCQPSITNLCYVVSPELKFFNTKSKVQWGIQHSLPLPSPLENHCSPSAAELFLCGVTMQQKLHVDACSCCFVFVLQHATSRQHCNIWVTRLTLPDSIIPKVTSRLTYWLVFVSDIFEPIHLLAI